MAAACNKNELITRPDPDGPNPYVAQVLDYRPAVGQFTNLLPRYEAGDTQQTMNAKALELLESKSPVTLGGYGGYIKQRLFSPAADKPLAHSGLGGVQDAEEGAPLFL